MVTAAVAAAATHQDAEVIADVMVMGVVLMVVAIAGAVGAETGAVVAAEAAVVVEEPALAVPSARAREMGVSPVVVITISVTAHVTQPRRTRIEPQSHERSRERYRGSE